MLRLVTCDLFCIAERLLKINSKYRVFYNYVKECFEIHNNLVPSVLSMQFCVPYDVLDERTIEYAWTTRIENSFDIEEDMLEHNKNLEQSAINRMQDQLRTLEDMFEFANGTSCEIEFSKPVEWI
ncbi:MAG: hypothetical protein FWE01_01790 [Firmicutes bacterium]|nr:hypothetical protein [Bacillota bacterium]